MPDKPLWCPHCNTPDLFAIHAAETDIVMYACNHCYVTITPAAYDELPPERKRPPVPYQAPPTLVERLKNRLR
jgi:hypothetical protein